MVAENSIMTCISGYRCSVCDIGTPIGIKIFRKRKTSKSKICFNANATNTSRGEIKILGKFKGG